MEWWHQAHERPENQNARAAHLGGPKRARKMRGHQADTCGLHFLAVQSGPQAEEVDGLWLLRHPILPLTEHVTL